MNTSKQPLQKIDIAIFSPMPEESEFLIEQLSHYPSEEISIEQFSFKIFNYHNKRILVANTGFGTTFATAIMVLIYSHFKPEFIFLTGTAGGIKSDLNICDVVIAESAFEGEIQGVFELLKNTPFESALIYPLNKKLFPSTFHADNELLKITRKINFEDQHVVHGSVVTSNSFPAPVELFEKIKSMNPYAIDMETSAFYQIAWLFQIPALAVRGISNALNSDGTDDNLHLSDIKGSTRAAAEILLKIIDSLISK